MPQTSAIKITALEWKYNKYDEWVLYLSYAGNYKIGNTEVSRNIPIAFVTWLSIENLPVNSSAIKT